MSADEVDRKEEAADSREDSEDDVAEEEGEGEGIISACKAFTTGSSHNPFSSNSECSSASGEVEGGG